MYLEEYVVVTKYFGRILYFKQYSAIEEKRDKIHTLLKIIKGTEVWCRTNSTKYVL